jgi:hypothetical protein
VPHRSEGNRLPARPDTVLIPGGAVAAVLDLIALLRPEPFSNITTHQPQPGNRGNRGGARGAPPPPPASFGGLHPNYPQVGLVGEGWGATVAVAVAQWEPEIVVALSLFHPVVHFGRFPYEGRELKALTLPVEVTLFCFVSFYEHGHHLHVCVSMFFFPGDLG